MSNEQETESEKPMPPRRGVGKSILIVLMGTLVLAVVLEGALRLFGVEPLFTPHHGMLRDAAPASETSVHAQNPRYITNDDGIWVANPTLPYVNEAGFRTPPFEEDPGARPTIAVIGDSFVWGMSAEPLENSFVDRVRNAGYRAVNLGIPGVGVVQYAGVAERYLQEIKPDAVVLVFYPGNDFDEEPPIQPGRPRYYLTDDIMLSAYSPEHEPWTLEEAYAHYAGTYGISFDAKLRRVLLSSSLVSAALMAVVVGSDAIINVDAAVAHVERIRRAAEDSGATFIFTVAPVRPEYESTYHSNDFCREVFRDFSPQIPEGLDASHYAPLPDAHFDNTGHEYFANFLLTVLEKQGFEARPDDPTHAPVTTFELDQAELTWEYFVQSLELSEEQRDKVLAIVNGLKDDFVDVFSRRPSAFEPSPLEMLAASLSAAPKAGESDGQPAFLKYADEQKEPNSGNTYSKVFAKRAEARMLGLSEILNDQQHSLFNLHFMDHLLDIDTGYNPLNEKIAGILRQTGGGFGTTDPDEMVSELAFDAFSDHFSLDERQAARARELVNELKVSFAQTLSKPARDGAQSPMAFLAALMADDALDEASRNQQFEAYAQSVIPEGQEQSYFTVFTRDSESLHGKFIELLSEEQRLRMPSLPIDSLMKVDTGFDPFGERLGQLMAGVGAGELRELRPQDKSWAGIAQALELAPERTEEIRGLIEAFRTEHDAILQAPTKSGAETPMKRLNVLRAEGKPTASSAFLAYLQEQQEAVSGKAYSALLEEAEIAVRRRIYALLNRAQRKTFEELVAGSLRDIATGERP